MISGDESGIYFIHCFSYAVSPLIILSIVFGVCFLGGRSFILVPVTSDVDVRRIDIIFPSGRQGRALYSTRSAFTNSSLLVLGPIDFTRHRFRLLVRGQVGDTEMGQLTESIFPARPEPQSKLCVYGVQF